MRLWYSTVKRGAHTLPPVKDILHDLGEVRALREQNPSEPKSNPVLSAWQCDFVFPSSVINVAPSRYLNPT